MTKILLIRHGHVEGIKPERFRGRAPLDLTELGRAEAQAVARRVAGTWRPSKIYTSPMGRCIVPVEVDIGAVACGGADAETELREFRGEPRAAPSSARFNPPARQRIG